MTENNQANAPTSNDPAEAAEPQHETVVDAVFDVAEAWATYGLNVAKLALQTSAKTLEKTAKALDTLSTNLKKNAA